jgi:hypothetical protein
LRNARQNASRGLFGMENAMPARMSKNEIIRVNPELLYSSSFDLRSNTTALDYKRQSNLLPPPE